MNLDHYLAVIKRWYIKYHFNRDARLGFYDVLAVMLRNKLPIKPAMESTREIHRTVKPRSLINHIFDEVWAGIHEGETLGDCLAPWIPGGEYLMIRAGAGDIGGVLETLVLVQSRLSHLTKQVINAMIMPTLYLVVFIASLFIVGVYLLPFVNQMFGKSGPGGAAPPDDLNAMGDFAKHGLGPSVILFILVIAALIWSLPRLTGPLRYAMDRLPGYSIYRYFAGAEFLLTLSGYLKQGIPIVTSLERIKEGSYGYRRWHVEQMLESMRAGHSVGQAFQTGLFSPEFEIKFMAYAQHIRGSEFTDMITRAAEDSVKEVTERTIKFAKRAESFTKAFLMFAFGWLGLQIFGAGFNAALGQ